MQMDLFNATAEKCIKNKEISREIIELNLGLIGAQTWEPRHKVHKYWGRKPSNLVSSYIEFFTSPGDVVLDLFCGSGVTVVEAARLSRLGVGYDFNPFAVKLTNALLNPPTKSEFSQAAQRVVSAVTSEANALFSTTCRVCSGICVVVSCGWEGQELTEVRYQCPTCKGRAKSAPPTGHDIALAETAYDAVEGAPDGDIYFGWEMQKLKRGNVTRWRDLFTRRNYRIASLLINEINKIDNDQVRQWLQITFSASLAQFTKMIADFSGAAGGPSWKINCYWLPKKWQELNPVRFFANRIIKSRAAITDLLSVGAPWEGSRAQVVDSRALPLKDASVDYIFTDPPYGGEGIQYGELTLLWCLWLGLDLDLSREVAFNPYRGFDQKHYDRGLELAFTEAYRVLKPDSWMTVTFANKDPVVWDGLMRACKNAGFRLVTAAPTKRSAPSLTETNMERAPKADLVITFCKSGTDAPTLSAADDYDLRERIRKIAKGLSSFGHFDVADVFDRVTIDWFSWFYENGQRPSLVQPTLEQIRSVLREEPAGG